jgi:hypothetical protein
MDQTTQQNAALVEQMAAAAASLNAQSNDMVQTVAVFNLPGDSSGNSDRKTFQMLGRQTWFHRNVR